MKRRERPMLSLAQDTLEPAVAPLTPVRASLPRDATVSSARVTPAPTGEVTRSAGGGTPQGATPLAAPQQQIEAVVYRYVPAYVSANMALLRSTRPALVSMSPGIRP